MSSKVGFCLEGGGADGGRQIGCLAALIAHGIEPDYLSGSSIGGIISGVYAVMVFEQGKSPERAVIELNSMWQDIRLSDFAGPSVLGYALPRVKLHRSLFKNRIKNAIIELLGKDYSIKNLPVAITGSDLQEAKQVKLSDCMLGEACEITACIPGVFEPVKGRYVDGGVTGNTPLSYLTDKVDNAYVLRTGNHQTKEIKNNWWSTLIRSWMVSIASAENSEIKDNEEEFNKVEVIDLSESGDSGMLEFTKENATKSFYEGYRYTNNNIFTEEWL